MVQSIVQVGKEYKDQLEREEEEETCGVPLSWQESIHCARWLLKRRDIWCGFRAKDELVKEIATLLYKSVAISVL